MPTKPNPNRVSSNLITTCNMIQSVFSPPVRPCYLLELLIILDMIIHKARNQGLVTVVYVWSRTCTTWCSTFPVKTRCGFPPISIVCIINPHFANSGAKSRMTNLNNDVYIIFKTLPDSYPSVSTGVFEGGVWGRGDLSLSTDESMKEKCHLL